MGTPEFRELEFMYRFWPVEGGNVLVLKLFLIFVERRIEKFTQILERAPNLTLDESGSCTRSLHGLKRLVTACRSYLPNLVSGWQDEMEYHFIQLIDEYKRILRPFFVKMRNRLMGNVSEVETSERLLRAMVKFPFRGNISKSFSLELISMYVNLLETLIQIIRESNAEGYKIGVKEEKATKILEELKSIYTEVEGVAEPQQNLANPQERNASQYYTLIRRFHFLLETIV